MELYEFNFTGQTPLIIHADDIEGADRLTEWRKNPKNKNFSTPGDDRSPAWTWATYLYTDGEYITVPSDNLMAAFRKAAAGFKLKGQTSFKSLSQSGMFIPDDHIPVLVKGKPIKISDVEKIASPDSKLTYKEMASAVEKLGFRLYMKRAKVGTSKHVRVRPRFDEWALKGTIQVYRDEITEDVLKGIMTTAAMDVGFCDWRPGSPQSPGPFGTSRVTVKKK